MPQAKDRPPSFQFYPRDLLSSTAVSRMSPEARGGYLMLLAHAWLQPRPGWLADDDEALCALSGLNGQWQTCRPQIARAFEVRKGWWVQTRMVSERRRQRRRYNQAKNGARATNRKRWSSVAQRPDSESLSVSPSFAVASAVEAESRTRSKEAAPPPADGPSARCLTRLATRFPNLDLPVIEAKMLAKHQRNPYKNLDRAMIAWCQVAEKNGWDAKANGTIRMTPEEWAKT